MDSYRSALIPVDERNNEPLAVRSWDVSPEIELTGGYNPGSCPVLRQGSVLERLQQRRNG